MKEDKYLSRISKKPLFRIMAWVCLVIIALLIAATTITGISGSKYFMGCLLLTIIVPVFMYVVLWIGRVLSSMNNNGTDTGEDNDENKLLK